MSLAAPPESIEKGPKALRQISTGQYGLSQTMHTKFESEDNEVNDV